jgi:hypothetical protein
MAGQARVERKESIEDEFQKGVASLIDAGGALCVHDGERARFKPLLQRHEGRFRPLRFEE